MSLKNYIKQVEQLSENAPMASAGAQKLTVKTGAATSLTDQSGHEVVSTTDPATAQALKAGKLNFNPDALGEDGGEDTALAQGVKTRQVSEELAEAFAQLESQFPHEVKMYKEGWGLDEDLYHRIAEACHSRGEVPHKVWHGDLNELRNFVENIYASHHGLVDEATKVPGVHGEVPRSPVTHVDAPGTVTPARLDAAERERKLKGPSFLDKAKSAAGRALFGPSDEELRTKPLDQLEEDDIEEATELERSLRASQQSKEETMFEGKETTDKGVKHTGSYGKRHGKEEVRDQYGAKIGKIDLDKETKKDEPKRGKGRPKKDAGDAGVAFDTSELDNAFGGAAKDAAKRMDKSHDKKKTVKHKVDEQISSWDQQLKTLLESKQINEGITVSTSMGQEQAPDSVSVSATDEDAHTLLKIIHDAGLGVKTDAREEMLKAHGMTSDGGSFSINPTDDEANDVEVVDFDTAQGDLSGEEDNGDDTLAQIKKMLGIGVDAAPEPKHPEGFDGEEGEEESEEEESGDDSKEVVDEEDVEEGNKFTGNLAKAREQGKEEADLDGDGDMEKVKPANEGEEKVEEGHQTCNECGGMLEEGHDCSAEQVEEGQLNEWANSREGISEDERFFATVKFMTGDISGGLNGQKKDQTVMPHTAVKVIEADDVAAQMKKLAGI
jgi:hypothetical protein